MYFSTINYIFGPPRSGKTTFLAKLSRKFLKEGRKVYANFSLKDAIRINDEDLGYFDFGEYAVLLLDECGVSYSNRDAFSKNGLMKDKDRLEWWKEAGHYKGTLVFVASQGWNDIDLKIRTLAMSYFFIRKWWFGMSIIKPVLKDGGIDENTHEPTDFYEFAVFLCWKIIIRRRYYKFFNSYEHKYLPPYPFTDPKETTKQGERYRARAKRRNSSLPKMKRSKRNEGRFKAIFRGLKSGKSSNDDLLA